jgi:hypothetical protein
VIHPQDGATLAAAIVTDPAASATATDAGTAGTIRTATTEGVAA